MTARAVFKNYLRLILFIFVYLFMFIYFSSKKNTEEIFLRDIIKHSFIDCVADKKHT